MALKPHDLAVNAVNRCGIGVFERLDDSRQPSQLIEVFDADGVFGNLPELFFPEGRAHQPIELKRSFAVRPAELLAAHLAARMVGERVQVVASARVGRVERELDAQNPEQLPVARLVGAESPGGPGALAYVGHPAVAALSLDPALSPALALPLGRPARAALGFLCHTGGARPPGSRARARAPSAAGRG